MIFRHFILRVRILNRSKHYWAEPGLKKGCLEGDLDEGELEIGQIAGLIHDIKPAAELVQQLLDEFEIAKKKVSLL